MKNKSTDKQTGRTLDMINGSIADKVLIFALPLALTGILQQLFNAADVAVIGQFVGTEAMAAVGANSSVIGLLVNLFIGISVGANVVISNFTGQGKTDGISRGEHTAIVAALLSGLFLAILGQIVAKPILTMLLVPEDVLPMAVLYLRIYMAGMPVILLYNFESAVFRSQGDTRTPLICLVTSGVINVMLNLFFVLVVGMTVDGVACATVIANAISSGLMFVMLLRRRDAIRLDIRKLRIDPRVMKEMVRIGLPAGIQGMVFSISNMCIQSAINQLGADVMAASAAAFNIEILVYYVVNAFGQATTTFTGQNYGAGKLDRCGRVAKICMALGIGVGMAVSLTLLAFGKQLLFLFNSDEIVITYGYTRLFCILMFEWSNVAMEIFSGAMRGYGYSLPPAIVTLVGVCGVRIAWVYLVFVHHPTFAMLLSVYPISWLLTSAALIGIYIKYRKKLYRLLPKSAR